MRICYFADGESIHIVRWCKHFADQGHDVHLISFKNVKIEKVTTHFIDTGAIAVGGGNWKVLFKYKKVKKIVKQIQPDVFHAHYATSYGITGALCGFHPYIITALGTDVLISPNQSKILKSLLKYAFSKADWITAMADHMKLAIENLGVDARKIQTLPFGIDPAVFNNTNSKKSSDSFIITSTRNFETVYNIPHLIKAVSIARKQIPGLRLNLIGAGSLQKEVEELVEKEGLKAVTTFFGKVPQPKIAEVMNDSHLFVSVSISDGNNISLNEAMACGTFCIATNIPANTQWIQDGINGFLVKIDDVEGLADKIVTSYQKYDKFQKIAVPMNASIIQEKAIWQLNMQKMENTYIKLVTNGK
ncbi:MAG: glycosyltransferase [Bacteroidetes bacterium]|nr:glycosyltransferase [Bacteroidota bacterium]